MKNHFSKNFQKSFQKKFQKNFQKSKFFKNQKIKKIFKIHVMNTNTTKIYYIHLPIYSIHYINTIIPT